MPAHTAHQGSHLGSQDRYPHQNHQDNDSHRHTVWRRGCRRLGLGIETHLHCSSALRLQSEGFYHVFTAFNLHWQIYRLTLYSRSRILLKLGMRREPEMRIEFRIKVFIAPSSGHSCCVTHCPCSQIGLEGGHSHCSTHCSVHTGSGSRQVRVQALPQVFHSFPPSHSETWELVD